MLSRSILKLTTLANGRLKQIVQTIFRRSSPLLQLNASCDCSASRSFNLARYKAVHNSTLIFLTSLFESHKFVQESCAIAKMTARCALYKWIK